MVESRCGIQEMLLSLYPAIVDLIGGIISNAAMTLTEIPLWKKSYFGVFEWHQNLVITTHLVHLPNAKRKGENHLDSCIFPMAL
jgi:hypothetical protein